MALERLAARVMRAAFIPALLLAAAFSAPPAHALRIVNYNILNFPGSSGSARAPFFRTILDPLDHDVMVAQEMQSQLGVDSIRVNVLNVIEPGEWASAPFVNGTDTDNALFYKPSKFTFVGQRSFYVSSDVERLVNEYQLRPVGYSAASATLYLYSVHLKASTGSDNVAQRLREATGLRDTMNALPPGTHCIVMGDFNIYTGTEGAFTKFLESQVDNDGRLYDPLNLPLVTWNNGAYASYHTQSPCLSGGVLCASGAATGGVDDRFDMFLPTYNWNDGEGLDLIAGTYLPVGNDGLHYNLNITDVPTIPEGAAYANALIKASDHLPIRVNFQVPAKLSIGGAPIAFGSVIVGATAPTSDVQISNPAIAPADELNYTVVAPVGFTAPGGPFVSNAGAPANAHTVTMLTGTPGVKAGNLVLNSDDPDQPAANAAVSGTVLRHASASLDSQAVSVSGTLDFGVHDPGEFGTVEAQAHNQGWDAVQARLNVTAAAITGGDGRFSIVDGTAPVLVSGVGQRYTIAFDDDGATNDSLYEATLTIDTQDETLPGATNQSDLVVTLQAKLTPLEVIGVGPVAPRAFAWFAPSPNPSRGPISLGFDLPQRGSVDLGVFDLSGRRVATLARGTLEADRHRLTWNGTDDAGRKLPTGLYFVRLTAAGQTRMSRLALIR